MSNRKASVGQINNWGTKKSDDRSAILPEGLSDEERGQWEGVMAAAAGNMHQFVQDSMRRAVADPAVRAELAEKHRERSKNEAAASLAGCDAILALPVETFALLLSLPEGEIVKLYGAASGLQKAKVLLDSGDMKSIRDMAVVIEVMEPEDGPMDEMEKDMDIGTMYPSPMGSPFRR